MKIVSFNINGIRARLHQLQALIDTHQPDVIGLQETKAHDEVFPSMMLKPWVTRSIITVARPITAWQCYQSWSL